MSRDENQDVSQQASQANATAIQRSQGWFLTPKPIKVLFKKFPLQTLPANKLPLRTVPHRGRHTLWIFTTEEDAKTGVPSFNPACLKWQTYLRVCGLEFNTIPSCNHASPSGTLPFLIPPSSPLSSSSKASNPVPSNKLRKWLWEQELSKNEPESIEYEAYGSLLDYRIREAWVCDNKFLGY
jgi:metaxin